ncbi:MAG: site-specific DNA-methyltransferase [Chloroflexi bacterium]|nr:site-specific DNA-methyltransferase [Chloroflexota bacterium]
MAITESVINDKYQIINGDCIEVMQDMPDSSIHCSIYSPPFGGLYHYSSNDRDLSNCDGYDAFFDHYEYVIHEISRITKPGRITAVHCTDIPSSNSGKDYYIDFPGDIIRAHEKHGFHMIARHTIWKEPLWVRNRTMTHNLSHKTIVDDGAYGGVAAADYMLIFRKDGLNAVPVEHPTGLTRYAGEEPIPLELLKYKEWAGKQTENRFSHWIWRHYASSIWDDIDMANVLPFQDCKDPDDEKHVHPLQLDVIARVVTLRTNPREIVFTPFMGVGSEVYGAVIEGRQGIGVELKESYYRQARKNMEVATTTGFQSPTDQKDLFG